MANMSINSSQIRKTLKEILKQIKGQEKGTQLNTKIKNLFNELTAKKKEIGVKVYHDARFSFLKEGSYFTTNKSKNAFINKQVLQFLYNEIKQIFLEIESYIYKSQIDNNLDYAIYFKGTDGKLYRASTKEIPKEQLRRTSKGALKTTKLQTYLRSIQNQEKNDIAILDINQHLGSFIGVIQATYKGKDNIPNRTISYGRLAEAFERHLQSNINHNYNDAPPWNYNQIWRFLRQSTSNVPWYLTGDVGGTQVKFIGSGDTRLTSAASIQDILNFFDYILSNEIDDEMINNVYSIFIGQIENASQHEIKNLAYQDLGEVLVKAVSKTEIKIVEKL